MSNCEAFEVVAISGPARVSTVLNNSATPVPGQVYSLQFQQGECIEIQNGWTTQYQASAIICYIGHATGGDATHLIDTNRNWPIGFFQWRPFGDPNLAILSGAGAGKCSRITDNTTNTLTFNAVAGMVPDSSSEYAIVYDITAAGFGAPQQVLTFVPPETGAYTVEIVSNLGFNNPYGRGTYVLQKASLPAVFSPIGQPRGITYDSVRDVFWVFDTPNQNEAFVCKFSTTGQALARISVGNLGVANITYCTNIDRLAICDTSGTLTIFDPGSLAVESSTPGAIVNANNAAYWEIADYCPSNGKVYLPAGVVVDPVAKTSIQIAGFGTTEIPSFIAGDGNVWYTSRLNYSGNPIKVVDPATDTVIHTVAVPNYSVGGQCAYASSTGLVYKGGAANPGHIQVFDPVTHAFVREVALDIGTNVDGVVFNPNDGFLYAGCEGFGGYEMTDFLKIDLSTETIVQRWLASKAIVRLQISTGGVIGFTSSYWMASETDFETGCPFGAFTP